MADFRTNESENFPIISTAPLIITKVEDGKIVQKQYSLKSKGYYKEFLADTENWNKDWVLTGCWPGNWSSDMFLLDINIIRPKVIERFGS
jgi:hypothetical protein